LGGDRDIPSLRGNNNGGVMVDIIMLMVLVGIIVYGIIVADISDYM
jgi:hypothetical protein